MQTLACSFIYFLVLKSVYDIVSLTRCLRFWALDLATYGYAVRWSREKMISIRR